MLGSAFDQSNDPYLAANSNAKNKCLMDLIYFFIFQWMGIYTFTHVPPRYHTWCQVEFMNKIASSFFPWIEDNNHFHQHAHVSNSNQVSYICKIVYSDNFTKMFYLILQNLMAIGSYPFYMDDSKSGTNKFSFVFEYKIMWEYEFGRQFWQRVKPNFLSLSLFRVGKKISLDQSILTKNKLETG